MPANWNETETLRQDTEDRPNLGEGQFCYFTGEHPTNPERIKRHLAETSAYAFADY